MRLFLPESWAADADRLDRAGVPEEYRRERAKGQIALELLDQVRAEGLPGRVVLADAGYGASGAFRRSQADRGLHYLAGVTDEVVVFAAPPAWDRPAGRGGVGPAGGRPQSNPQLRPGSPRPVRLRDLAAGTPLRRVTWRVGTKDRVAVQAGLPRWVCNAWTQPGDLGVSRHDLLGEHACLACLYMPKGQVPNADQLVARAINMPEALGEVRTLLHNNAPVGEAFVRRMATAMTVPVEPLLRFAAKPLGAFYAEAVCGGMLLKLGAHAAKADTQVPMAFQSALAGVLLAAELVSHVANLKGPPPPSVTRINLLRPLAEYITFLELKRPMCICQDSDYQNVYRRKYLGEH